MACAFVKVRAGASMRNGLWLIAVAIRSAKRSVRGCIDLVACEPNCDRK
jgi:hypothetical protein